jgi:hypothetical protein
VGEVLANPLTAVLDALLGEQRVRGHPEATAGQRGGAADVLRLLDHQNRQAGLLRHEGGEHARAGADDDEVVVVLVLAVGVGLRG